MPFPGFFGKKQAKLRKIGWDWLVGLSSAEQKGRLQLSGVWPWVTRATSDLYGKRSWSNSECCQGELRWPKVGENTRIHELNDACYFRPPNSRRLGMLSYTHMKCQLFKDQYILLKSPAVFPFPYPGHHDINSTHQKGLGPLSEVTNLSPLGGSNKILWTEQPTSDKECSL